MSSFKYIIIFALTLLSLTSASSYKGISLNYKTDYDLSDLKCFVTQGKNMIRIPIFTYKTWKISSSFATHYKNAISAGFKIVDVIADIVNNGDTNTQTPAYICSSISETLPTEFNGTVWLGILDPAWNGIIEDRYDFLETVVNYCHAVGLNVGIHTDPTAWNEIFATSTRTGIPNKLSYSIYSTGANFEDFEPFGHFDATGVRVKEYELNEELCGRTVDLLFQNDTVIVDHGSYLTFDQVQAAYSAIRPKDDSQNYDPSIEFPQIMNPIVTGNNSGWSSGAYAEQWIEFTLNNATYIDQLELLPNIHTPTGEGKVSGTVQIDITCEDGAVSSTKIDKVFDKSVFETIKVGVKITKVRITTLKIDSWVGWTRVLFKL